MSFVKRMFVTVAINIPISFLVAYGLLDLTVATAEGSRGYIPDFSPFLVVYVIGFMVVAPFVSTQIVRYWKDSDLVVNRRFIGTLVVLSIPFMYVSTVIVLELGYLGSLASYIGFIAILPAVGAAFIIETVAGTTQYAYTYNYALGAVFWSTIALIVAMTREYKAKE